MPPGGRGLPSRWCPALPEGVTGAAKGPLAAVLTAGPSAHQPAAGRGRTLSRSFPARPESVAAARRCLAAFMAGSPASSDSLVCLSELATNAISHSRSARSGGRFTVTARRTPAGWHVAVHDAGGPWQPGQDRDGTGHRGLAIVAALAARWGIEPRSEPGSEAGSEPGRTVWFEIGDVPG